MQSNFDRRYRTLSASRCFLTVVYCLSFSAMAADPAPEVAPGVGLHMDPAKWSGKPNAPNAQGGECRMAAHPSLRHVCRAAEKSKATNYHCAGLAGGIRRNGFVPQLPFHRCRTRRSDIRPSPGVSCESCHGAAKRWLTIHNDYGAGKTRDTETPEHKEKRHADAVRREWSARIVSSHRRQLLQLPHRSQ